MTNVSSNYSVNPQVGTTVSFFATSGSASAPATGYLLLFLLRQLAMKTQQERLNQANTSSEIAVKAGVSAADSQIAAGAQDKTLSLLETIQGASGIITGGLGIGLGVVSSRKASEAADLRLGVSKLERATGPVQLAAENERAEVLAIRQNDTIEQIKGHARNPANQILRPENGSENLARNMGAARDQLKADAKQASEAAEKWRGYNNSFSSLTQGLATLGKSVPDAIYKEAKAREEAAKTLSDTEKETASSITQTARAGVSNAEQLMQTVDNAQVELNRAYQMRA